MKTNERLGAHPMDELLARLARHGLPDPNVARHALHATLAVLGERLVDDEALALAEGLPDELVPFLDGAEYDRDFDAAELYARVARRERSTGARAKEHAEMVIAALGESLDLDRRRRVARALPAEIGELLLGHGPAGEPPPYQAPRRAESAATLASGRSGAEHPLSESAPPRGHSHSVAENPAPHEETKLSSSKGLTQERLQETLAESRRGAV